MYISVPKLYLCINFIEFSVNLVVKNLKEFLIHLLLRYTLIILNDYYFHRYSPVNE